MSPRVRAGLIAIALVASLAACRVSVMPTSSPPAPSASADPLEHRFPELERLLPATMAGVPAQARESYDGEAAADDETLYFGLYPLLVDAVGYDDVGRIQIADESWPVGRGWLSLRIFKLDTSQDLWPRVMAAALAAEETSSNRWQRATIGGREVLSALDLRPESVAIYVFRRGDVIYEIVSPDRAKAEAIVAALP